VPWNFQWRILNLMKGARGAEAFFVNWYTNFDVSGSISVHVFSAEGYMAASASLNTPLSGKLPNYNAKPPVRLVERDTWFCANLLKHLVPI